MAKRELAAKFGEKWIKGGPHGSNNLELRVETHSRGQQWDSPCPECERRLTRTGLVGIVTYRPDHGHDRPYVFRRVVTRDDLVEP